MAVAGTVVLGLSSCYKKFDPKSYQPAFTFNGYTSVAEIGAGSLVGYWAFDGSYIDSISKTAATGVGTSFTGGFKGQAFQGADKAYVISDLPSAIKNLKSFTIDYWIKSPQNTTGILAPIVISKDNDFWGALDMFYENGSTANTGNLKVHFNGQSEVWFTNGNITNPWDKWVNIALTYDAARSTVPKLVAKGVDSLAARIRETAREHGVPIVANPPLARTLHQLPLGTSVPPELYKAVAELIAYVWRLNGRRTG